MKKTLFRPCFIAAVLLQLGFAGVSLAQQDQTLYSTPASPSWRDNYSGPVGCEFETGSSNVIVSHLGYFCSNAVSGLVTSHYVGVYEPPLATPVLVAQVQVPAGTSADIYTNSFYWMHLDPPLLLSSNTTYVVAALPENGDGDLWGSDFTPTWNSWFVGSQATSTRTAVYAPSPSDWPASGFSTTGGNETYCIEGLGYIQVGAAHCGVQTTNVAVSAGATISALGFSTGQQPITNQWWEAGSPNVLISTTTNDYAPLSIANASTGDSGAYFMTSSNALGGEQSSNVIVSVTAYPVGISEQPTNETVYANYQANFFMTATGTPPISYQWSGNGLNISGATSNDYSFTAMSSNNGEEYSCMASNDINDTPYTADTFDATLTVIPNVAPPQEVLHGYNSTLDDNEYSGLQGGQFTVGNTPVVVTHLGYFAWPANTVTNDGNVTCTLTDAHRVGIWNGTGTTLLGYVTVPAGSDPVVDGYCWAQLQPALLLATNTEYLLLAETFNSDTPAPGGDPWGDTYSIPDLNPYFATKCDAIYGGGPWPTTYLGGGYSGQMYSAPNMAILPTTTPIADILPTNVVEYAGDTVTLTAYVVGEPPVTVQWFTNGVPLAGQTNLTLTLNLTLGSSSTNYYLIATNTVNQTGVQSDVATVTVVSDTPAITNNVSSQTVFDDQTVQLSVGAEGEGALSYQWTFNGTAIAGATNSMLTLSDASAGSVGNYQVIITNNYGAATSSVASLTVEVPTWGSYPSAVFGANMLLFYPLNDNDEPTGVATNWGGLGFAYNGLYQGGSSTPGPTNVNFGYNMNFDTNDAGDSLDGVGADVQLPPLTNSLGATSVTVSNITIAAWVYDSYPYEPTEGQEPNAAIFFQRSADVFGLSVNSDPSNNADALRYTWNDEYETANGFDLPTNEWALVAMTVNPTNTAVYLQYGNGLQATNFPSSNPSAVFAGNSYIGWDSAGGSGNRLWTGPIADVMVFDQALSPVAINALYYGVPASATLTLSPAADHALTVSWPGGTLLESTNVLGPWTPVINATNGIYTLSPTQGMEFYRVQLQP